MRTFAKMAAQGDLLIIKVSAIPEGVTELQPEKDQHVVAHSETGHHHTLYARGVRYFRGDDMTGYVKVLEATPLVHHRSFDTHEPIMLDPGNYMLRRQREYTPQGYRRVED